MGMDKLNGLCKETRFLKNSARANFLNGPWKKVKMLT